MKFVIFAFLLIGKSSALLNPVLGLTGMISGFNNNAKALNNMGEAITNLTSIIAKSSDAARALSSFTDVFGSATAVLQRLADDTFNLGGSFASITDSSGFSLSILELSDLVPNLNEEVKSENAVTSVIHDIINGIGASTTTSGDLSGAAEGLQNVKAALQYFAASLTNLKGVSGVVVGAVASTVIGLSTALDNASAAMATLAAAIELHASDLAGVDFSGVIEGLIGVSSAMATVAVTLRGLTTLSHILGGLWGGI